MPILDHFGPFWTDESSVWHCATCGTDVGRGLRAAPRSQEMHDFAYYFTRGAWSVWALIPMTGYTAWAPYDGVPFMDPMGEKARCSL